MSKTRNNISKIYSFLKNGILGFLICYYFKTLVYSLLGSGIAFKNNFIELSPARNTGSAFSLFNESNLALAIIASVVVIFIICYFLNNLKTIRILDTYALSFLTAGIVSNTAERFIYGYVTDYFRLTFVDFPIFNMADIYINIGAGLLIISILFIKRGKHA